MKDVVHMDGSINPVESLGIRLVTKTSPIGIAANELAMLSLRRNPKRAHLLTSTVLGKHIPTDPRVVRCAAAVLGLLVDAELTERDPAVLHPLGEKLSTALRAGTDEACVALDSAVTQALRRTPVPQQRRVVLGYAETATGLGAEVARALGADYLHSTRRQVAGIETLEGFEEAHSHATSHLITPHSHHFLGGDGPLILVDDELTTGATAFNTIEALHRRHPRPRYVIACLTDMRSEADAAALAARAAALGAELLVVSLARGEVELPPGIEASAAQAVAELEAAAAPAPPPARAEVTTLQPNWPADVPEGGRHGITVNQLRRLDTTIAGVAHELSTHLGDAPRDVLVLGTEEFMATPLSIARVLDQLRPDFRVRFSTTTRSPVLASDTPGYPIRTALAFNPSEADPGGGRRFAYNVAGSGTQDIVVMVDPPAAGEALTAPDGLVAALAPHADRVVVVVLGQQVPGIVAASWFETRPLRGPEFGSYSPADVTWLLKDLSDASLEAPTTDRERAIQADEAHYAESLPQEFQPSAEYTELFHAALRDSAARLATAVGIVGEILVAERGSELVLASLARAGTPIGVLLRRWLGFSHGLDVPHYALSIVRARGIDEVALDHLASQHDPANVVFVDGWTGKGAIIRELTVALQSHNAVHGTAFNPDLAVLADPGECVRTFGTRDDFLIPSACLNSTVSGLVSRTVLNDELIGPRDFHGAKFYAELAQQDVSNLFVEAVAGCFSDVAPEVTATWQRVAQGPRVPTWSGWAAVERISQQYGVGDVNFVKPGVGETTRVLLRRVPDRILIRPDRVENLRHVLLLAQQRGVPVEEVADLPYSCMGLIARTSGGEG